MKKVWPLHRFVQALNECGALVRLSFDMSGYDYKANCKSFTFIKTLVRALNLSCELETRKAIAELGASARVLPYLRKASSLQVITIDCNNDI